MDEPKRRKLNVLPEVLPAPTKTEGATAAGPRARTRAHLRRLLAASAVFGLTIASVSRADRPPANGSRPRDAGSRDAADASDAAHAATFSTALHTWPLMQVIADPPRGETLEEARSRYKRGVALFEEGNYKLAWVEFERAYELSIDPVLLLGLARTLVQLNDCARASTTLERFLAEVPTADPELRKEAASALEFCAPRIGFLTVTSNPEGVEVYLDGEFIGLTPLVDARVNAGTHDLAATSDRHQQLLMIAGRDHMTIELPANDICAGRGPHGGIVASRGCMVADPAPPPAGCGCRKPGID